MRYQFISLLAFLCMMSHSWGDLAYTLDNSQTNMFDGGAGLSDAQFNVTPTSNSIDGDGFALLFVTGASGAFAETRIDLVFTATQTSDFSLGLSLSSFVDNGLPDPGTAGSSFSLTGSNVNLLVSDPQPNFTASGTFLAGESYHLVALARVDQGASDGTGGAQFVFSMVTFTAVPEPSSIAMSTLFLVSGFGYFRKRKQKMSPEGTN